MRIGNGFDVHKLVEGRPLVLAGVTIPFHKGLEGHSDGDSLAHAIIDALLGASALGDIGMHFPSSDQRLAGADSMALLAQVSQLLADHAYTVVNIDSTIICEEPKLSPHFPAMRQRLAEVLHVDVSQVSVKATTNEKLGFLGRGEAIAAQAVVLIE